MREYNLTGDTKLSKFFYSDDPSLTDDCGDDTCLNCPDGSLIVINEMEHNRDDEELHIKGRATIGTTITIINADTDEILVDGIRGREGKWEAEIENVGGTLKNITFITSNGIQSTRRSKIVKMTMMIMTISVRRIAKRLPPVTNNVN